MVMKSVGKEFPEEPGPWNQGEDIVCSPFERRSGKQANQLPQGVLQLLQ